MEVKMGKLFKYLSILGLCYINFSDLDAARLVRPIWEATQYAGGATSSSTVVRALMATHHSTTTLARWMAVRHASTISNATLGATATPSFREHLKEFAETPWQKWADKGLDPIAFAAEVNKQYIEDLKEPEVRRRLLQMVKEYSWKVINNCATELPKEHDRTHAEAFGLVVLEQIAPALSIGGDRVPYDPSIAEKLTDLRTEIFLPMTEKDEKELTSSEKNLLALNELLREVTRRR
jgi:hypothetical protein